MDLDILLKHTIYKFAPEGLGLLATHAKYEGYWIRRKSHDSAFEQLST